MLETDLRLDREEQLVHQFIHEKYPLLLEQYKGFVPKARMMIMERLVNALLREGFVSVDEIEKQFPTNELVFTTRSGNLRVPIEGRYSYQRYKIVQNPLHNDKELHHPCELLEWMVGLNEEQTQTFTNIKQFRKELSNSVANLGLSLLFQQERFRAIQADENAESSSFELALKLSESCPSVFFEQLGVTGHLLHPGTKSKFGLTLAEIMQYSAEFDGTVQVRFIAIHKDVTYVNRKLDLANIQSFWAAEYPELVEELNQLSDEAKNYYLVPVHEWQYEHTIGWLYTEELSRGDVVKLDFKMEAYPTLSVRTVVPVGKSFHIKLPLNIQMTSAVRTISPNSIHNGPELTLIVNEIMERENGFNGKLAVIGEDFGLRFASSDESEPNFRDRNKNLSYLIRQAPEALLGENQQAIVACALFNLSPASQDILLYELVEQYQLKQANVPTEESLLSFFHTYIDVLLSGIIPMMSKYGIGLEAHLQNTLMVFEDGLPVKTMIRDLGGVRVDSRRLQQRGFSGTYYPGSVTIDEDETGMHNKVIHTAFQSHIGEVAYHLSKRYGVNEQLLWQMVKDRCLSIFGELMKEDSMEEPVKRDIEALLGDKIQTKALTLMRLTDDVTDYAFIELPNPLK